MTLNRGDKLRYLDKRRGSTPFAAHHLQQQQHLHRRSMPVDERELQASLPPSPRGELSQLMRCTSYSPADDDEAHRQGWASDSSDSVISSGSDSDSNLYKVILLGEHGVGKTSLARIFGGVEDCPDAEEAGNTYDRSIIVDGEEASLVVFDIWEQDDSQWLQNHCMKMGDAYIIVYSVTDKVSFEKASELRIQLRRARQTEDIPIILVGNKSDLVRSREVSVDGIGRYTNIVDNNNRRALLEATDVHVTQYPASSLLCINKIDHLHIISNFILTSKSILSSTSVKS
ncbi:GTP-binding protein RAD isoform X2 [Podarcis muralis]